jgi:ATP-binding cassette subfamily C protein
MALILARTVSTMGKAQQDWQTYVIAEQGFEAIEETITAARAMREPNEGGVAPQFAKDIEFRDVVFDIEDTRIIHGVSFTIPRGRVTTIHGTSGAGKTTLVDLLLGLHKPTGGQILIDGINLSEFDLLAWQKLTGYVPQELMLFHDTVAENVTLGQQEFSREDVERALEQAGAMDFVSKIPEGMDTIVGERGARLSGGQRQRIAIARALVHRPQLLILDEATTALDPVTEAAIVANVCRLSEETGLTVLAISHQPAWARAAQHLIHLKAGEVFEIIDRTEPERATSAQKTAISAAE